MVKISTTDKTKDKVNGPFLTFEVEGVRESVGEHGAAASS